MVLSQVWVRLHLWLVFWILQIIFTFFSSMQDCFYLWVCVADGVSECSATLDDSVSEEEGSFDELTDGTPYLQPGVELSVLKEVRLRREACHVTELVGFFFKNVYPIYDATFSACMPRENPCEMFSYPWFQNVWRQFN